MISTPRNPTSNTAQRVGPTFSCRKYAEASVEKIGEENMIAVTPASGIMLSAISSIVCEPTCELARIA